MNDNDWAFRCADCGHGEHLTACSYAVVFGRLGRDGYLAVHDDVDETELAEDSIQCSVHASGQIEKRIGGVWTRWKPCEKCRGTGRDHPDYKGWDRNVRERLCSVCRGRLGENVPVDDEVPA